MQTNNKNVYEIVDKNINMQYYGDINYMWW